MSAPDGIWSTAGDCDCPYSWIRRDIRKLWPYAEGDQFSCYCGQLWTFAELLPGQAVAS